MIEKALFCEVIDSMRVQYYNDKKNGELLQEAFSLNEFPIFDNGVLYKQIIKLLGLWFDKQDIEEYCFFQNFGKPTIESECETSEMLYDRLANTIK